MMTKKYLGMSLGLFMGLWVSIGLLIGCNGITQGINTEPASIQTQLLVRAPDGPLPLNKSISVRSLTEATGGVSHVELYAVEIPSGQKNVLIRSDPAPSIHQPSFTAVQMFTPIQPGHYVIKVVGYNWLGQRKESDYLGFDVQ